MIIDAEEIQAAQTLIWSGDALFAQTYMYLSQSLVVLQYQTKKNSNIWDFLI